MTAGRLRDPARVADRIAVHGIRATGYHGVLAAERAQGQPFVVDVVLDVDTSAAARTDALAETVNYAAVAREVVNVIEGPPVDLIETLAERVAGRCLADTRVEQATVTVHKPQAPVGVPFGDVSVTIVRSRS